VQLYRADKPDLTEWKHLGSVFNALERETFNIECPNLFKLDGRWVLIISPHRPCEYYVGDLDLERVRFTPYCHGVLDAGDAYASNISVDDKGRTILWLWGRTNTPPGRGWGSVITLPRILSIGPDGFLRQQPVPELASLRGEAKTYSVELSDKPFILEGGPGDAAEIEAEFGGASGVNFELRRSPEGKPGAVVSIQRGYLSLGSARAYIGNASRRKVRIFLDKRCVEVYVDDGLAAIYGIVEAGRQDQGIAVAAQGGGPGGRGPAPAGAGGQGRLESLRVWPMKGAGFSLERFHV
jgi:beta-fructofuranosidase